jgi:hypothetical protein
MNFDFITTIPDAFSLAITSPFFHLALHMSVGNLLRFARSVPIKWVECSNKVSASNKLV